MKKFIVSLGLIVTLGLNATAFSQGVVTSPRAGSVASGSGGYYDDYIEPGYYGDEQIYHNGYDDCFDCAVPCETSRFWFQADALLWTNSAIRLPALATTSLPGTSIGDAGVLGNPSTSVLIGNSDINNDARAGGRFTLGYMLNPMERTSIQTSFFFLSDENEGVAAASNGSSILARPFYDVSAAAERAQILAFPGLAAGSISVDTFSEVASSEIMFRRQFDRYANRRIDYLVGYRFFRVDEGITINDQLTSTATGGNVVPGTTISGFDYFETENEFHGGQLGLTYHIEGQRWGAHLSGKVALGNMRQVLIIDGQTRTMVPGGGINTSQAGLLTQPSNIGEYKRDEFAVIPEFGANISYNVTDRLTARVGYTFIYISDVLRPENHINLATNPTQVPGPTIGPPAPRPTFDSSEYWVQGMNFGLEYRF